jgi:hypothetical protein
MDACDDDLYEAAGAAEATACSDIPNATLAARELIMVRVASFSFIAGRMVFREFRSLDH